MIGANRWHRWNSGVNRHVFLAPATHRHSLALGRCARMIKHFYLVFSCLFIFVCAVLTHQFSFVVRLTECLPHKTQWEWIFFSAEHLHPTILSFQCWSSMYFLSRDTLLLSGASYSTLTALRSIACHPIDIIHYDFCLLTNNQRSKQNLFSARMKPATRAGMECKHAQKMVCGCVDIIILIDFVCSSHYFSSLCMVIDCSGNFYL